MPIQPTINTSYNRDWFPHPDLYNTYNLLKNRLVVPQKEVTFKEKESTLKEVTLKEEYLKVEDYINIPDCIKSRIDQSRDILNYKFNWNDNGASEISPKAFEHAITFLKKYAERIYDVSNKKKEILPPSISPVPNGSVDLEWNLKHSYLLINFSPETEDSAFYYLAFKDGDGVTLDANGIINTKNVNDKFASNIYNLS